jgi:glycosyltransferase involved in cell wall biosynthesis
MTRPLVSVIIPVFNCERYLGGALESISREEYGPLEVVVVDDGSTDRSAEVARSYPVRLLGTPHNGVARARNAGLDAASGELITFLDADDVWMPGSLGRRVDRLLERPELDAVFGLMEVFVEPGVQPPPWYRSAWEEEPQNTLMAGWLMRRRVFEKVGRFDTTYEIGEDTEWLARSKDAHLNVERIPEVVMRYRFHANNTTRRREVLRGNLVRALKQSIDRQRAENA